MALLLLVLALSARAQAPAAVPSQADQDWAVATSRMLGAAGTMRERAWQLKGSASAVVGQARAGGASALHSDARELHQAVVSARLAAGVLAERAGATPAP